MADSKEFWDNILRAVEATPREAKSIRGASGLQHPVLAVGIDNDRGRLLIVSGENDARSAVLAHADIQSALPSIQVLVARPLAFSLSEVARSISSAFGNTIIGSGELERLAAKLTKVEFLKPHIDGAIRAFQSVPLNIIAQFMQLIQEGSLIEAATEIREAQTGAEGSNMPNVVPLRLDKLIGKKPEDTDYQCGICPIPLYAFSETEIEHIQNGKDIEAIRESLRLHDIMQYFFPAPDQLVLGLVDRGISGQTTLIDQLLIVPGLGHPFGPKELTANNTPLTEIVDALQDRRLLVEGEIGLEVSPEGKSVRATVRFKPREGVLSKLINRFSLNIDLKDIFKGSGGN